MIKVKNYLFNLAGIREVRGADKFDNGIYISFVGGYVKFYDYISLEEFYLETQKEN